MGRRTAELAVALGLTAAGGGALAGLVGRARRREAAARRTAALERSRAELLARAGELLDQGGDPRAALGALAGLAVPDLAQLCIVDVLRDGAIRPEAIVAEDPDIAARLRQVREETPPDPASDHPVAVALRTGEPQLLAQLGPADLERIATSPRHLQLMRHARYRSTLIVPLTARGLVVGTMTLVTFRRGRVYGEDDLRLARDLARRAALAIHHARLHGALAETEQELEAVLEALAEAVTVQRPGGELVYANRAALDMLGASGVDGRYMDDWELRDVEGGPLDLERLPGRRVLAGEPSPEPLLIRATDRRSGETFWRVVKAAGVADGDGRPRLAVNVIEDVSDARRDEIKQRFLARASKLLGSSLEIEATLEKVAQAAVPELADWCAVDMPDERGDLRRVATADTRRERVHEHRLVIEAGELEVGPPAVLRSGRAELYATIDEGLLRLAARDERQLEAFRAIGPLSALVVPLRAGERVIGTITLGTTRDSGRRLDAFDLELAEELGRRAGVAVDHARVHGERTEIAATLQAALLPPRLPVIPGLSIAARFRAAGSGTQVGGDFYDLFTVDGAWVVLIGDVTGKGPQAAATTSLARYTMRTAARYERSPARIHARLNEALLAEPELDQLCTAVCARLEGSRVTVSCAGHPPPLLAREGRVAPLGEPGTLLGAFGDGAWTDTVVDLERNDVLLLYTDGVTDTRGAQERFGIERLAATLAGLAGAEAEEVAAGIEEALRAFESGEQRDDVALLVARATEAGPGSTSIVAEESLRSDL